MAEDVHSDKELRLREDLSRIVCGELNRLNWTQEFLADKAGYSQLYVSKILACEANWSTETVGRLCFALGVHPVLVRRDKAPSTVAAGT